MCKYKTNPPIIAKSVCLAAIYSCGNGYINIKDATTLGVVGSISEKLSISAGLNCLLDRILSTQLMVEDNSRNFHIQFLIIFSMHTF